MAERRARIGATLPAGEAAAATHGREPRLRRLRGRDPLGLRRALADWLLPALVAAMALLAALALTGAEGAGSLATRWQQAAGGQIIVQLPPEGVAAAVEHLATLPGVAEARPVAEAQLRELLVPWLGDVPGLPLPGMVEIRLASPAAEAPVRDAAAALPGARVEQRGEAVTQALRVAEGVRGLAWVILGIIGLVATALVAVATRAGIAARSQTILILHELGARDADIAGRFARRLGWLCGVGAVAGLAVALPALWLLADAAIPVAMSRAARLTDLPWGGLVLLPLAAAAIGWLTARLTVAAWLRRLP
jgi:cell division transport system permease protein